jgi:hypothetical protein
MSTTVKPVNTGLIENPQFLSFDTKIIIQPVAKFKVSDFFKDREGNIPMHLGESFKTGILEKSKDLELSLENETPLSKFKLIPNVWDSDIHFDFKEKPIIPILTFLPLLKALIEAQPKGEAKEDGLDNSGKSNVFHVDLTEINPSLGVVAARVLWAGGEWRCFLYFLNTGRPWYTDGFFFSLAIL